MKTRKNLFFLLFAFFLLPLMADASTIQRYCFVDVAGSVYDFRGGTPGKKAFVVQVSNVFCPSTQLTGIASFATISSGFLITTFINRDVAGTCKSYQQTISIDPHLLSGSGTYDNLPRSENPDGEDSFTRVACPGLLKPFPAEAPKSSSGAGAGNQQ